MPALTLFSVESLSINAHQPFLSAFSFSLFISFWGVLDFFVPSASKYRSNLSDDLSAWFGGTRIKDQFLWYIVPLVVSLYIFHLLLATRARPHFRFSLCVCVCACVCQECVALVDTVCFGRAKRSVLYWVIQCKLLVVVIF